MSARPEARRVDRIAAQAAKWLVKLDRSNASQRRAFAAWLKRSVDHRMAYRRMRLLDLELRDIQPHRWTRILGGYAAHQPDVSLAAGTRPWDVARWWGLATTLLITLVLGGYYAQTQHWFAPSYSTRAGETRVVTFEEGTVAHLNTRSKVRWIGSRWEREVEMASGEVLFDVVHDEAHPFRVVLDHSEIRVLGTRFNVYRKPDGDTTITVLEGTVEVRGFGKPRKAPWTRMVHANEQIEFRPAVLIREPHQTPTRNAVLWTKGVLEFHDEPLSDVLDDLSRYTDKRIMIRDPALAQRRIGGVLSTRDIQESLRTLQVLAQVTITENADAIVFDRDSSPHQSGDTRPP